MEVNFLKTVQRMPVCKTDIKPYLMVMMMMMMMMMMMIIIIVVVQHFAGFMQDIKLLPVALGV